jgi:hypothetical protein
MASNKTKPQAKSQSQSTRGGNREGAGRKRVYTLMEKMAIFLRIAEVQKENDCSKNKAIEILKGSGELPAHGVSNIGRYTTASHLSREIHKILAVAPTREGLINLIDKPKPDRSKNSNL